MSGMRRFLILLPVLAALISSACLEVVTNVKVNADGSGTIFARMLYTREGQQRLKDFAPLLGGGAGTLPKLTEADARSAADRFGAGVTFVSATPINGAQGDGIEATYAFKDINEVGLGASPAQLPMGDPAMGAGGPPIKFSLTHDPSVLRIQTPPPDFSAAAALQPDPNSQPDANLMSLVRNLVQGAHVAVSVEPAGAIVKTNAPYRDGPRIVLLDIQLDQLFSESGFARLAALKNLDDLKAFVKDTPGVKITLEPEVQVEFKPQ
jgi:hypothetical protein